VFLNQCATAHPAPPRDSSAQRMSLMSTSFKVQSTSAIDFNVF